MFKRSILPGLGQQVLMAMVVVARARGRGARDRVCANHGQGRLLRRGERSVVQRRRLRRIKVPRVGTHGAAAVVIRVLGR